MTIGIYKISNNINGKCYIGQSWNIEKRWKHYISINCKNQRKLHHALKKYGVKNFTFEILEIFDNNISQDILNEREIHYIDCFNSIKEGYNLTEGGSNGKLSEETKKLISEKHKGKTLSEEHIEKLKESHRGIIPSKETLKKRSDAIKGIPLSEEHKKKIGIANSKSLKGKKLSEATKQKIGEKSKLFRHTKDSKRKISEAKKGKPLSILQQGDNHPRTRKDIKEIRNDIVLNGYTLKQITDKYSCTNKVYYKIVRDLNIKTTMQIKKDMRQSMEIDIMSGISVNDFKIKYNCSQRPFYNIRKRLNK